MSAIVKIYGNNVLKGKKNFDEVPVSIADEVREYILGIDPNFFDPTEESVEEEVEEVEEPNGDGGIDENATPTSGGSGEEGAEESETDETAEEVVE